MPPFITLRKQRICRLGFAVVHSGLIDPLPNPIEGSHGIRRRIKRFPPVQFVGGKNLRRRRAAVFLSGPHHGFGNFQGIVALAGEGLNRPILRGQDDSYPRPIPGPCSNWPCGRRFLRQSRPIAA